MSLIVTAALNWATDSLLREPFEQAELRAATLVRLRPTGPPRAAVLHVHGYNDYFFQAHLARAFTDAGFAFYAVDLRTAGRSLRPGEIPHFVTDLQDQATDIAEAARTLRTLHPGLPLVVHAHSTGGLTASLWAHAHRNAGGTSAGPDALVLESPFFAFPAPVLTREVDCPWSPDLPNWPPRR
jgi:alpha-beta hydrolase superfamily lysophospholipase